MKRHTSRSEDTLPLIKELQKIETRNIEFVRKDIPKVKNPLIKAMLRALALEAEKRSVLQGMIADSVEKEAVHLSPDELQHLSGHFNRHIEADEKALSFAEEAFEKSELAIPRSLLSYLITDMKKRTAFSNSSRTS